jgi:hypothetical protein
MNLYSDARKVAVEYTLMVGVLLLLIVGYAAYPLIGAAQAATSESLTINAFSLPDGDAVSVLVEIRAGGNLIKSGFAPLTIAAQAGTIYTIKVSNSQSYAFDHWQDGSKSNTKAILLSEDTTLAAFFKKVSMPPNLTVNAMTPNGEELHMWTTVRSGLQTVGSGLTPFTFSGAPGRTYQLTVGNQEAESASLGEGAASLSGPAPISIIFNHWQDNNDRSRTRDITLPADGSSLNLLGVYNKGDRVTLEDLGVLQLVSHDLYNTIRDGPNPGSIEDERLNLSTLLDHGEDQIILGGEPRNSENIALHTVAVKLGKMYLDLVIDKKMSPEAARAQTVQVYLQMVAKAYEDTFHEPFPDAAPSEHEVQENGEENLTGDLSLRAIHSYVPGHIMVNGVDTMILDPSLRGKTLSDEDMQQLSKPLDGTFDPVFRNVTIFLPPPNPPPNLFTIDLFERDSSFAKQFGTDVSFEEFMGELKDGRFDENEKVMFYLREDIANGLMPPEEEGEQEGGDDNAAVAAQEAIAGNATAAVSNTTAVASGSTAGGSTLQPPPITAAASTPAAHNGTGTVQEEKPTQATQNSNNGNDDNNDSNDDEQEQADDDNSGEKEEKHWSASDGDRNEHNDDDDEERDSNKGDDNNNGGGDEHDEGDGNGRDGRHDHQHDNNNNDDDDRQDRRSERHNDDDDEDGSRWSRHHHLLEDTIEKIIQQE